MKIFIFVATILIIFSNSEAAPTSQRGQPGKQRHHLEDVEVKTSSNGHTIAGEREPKEASDNLQEEQEHEKEQEQRQVGKNLKKWKITKIDNSRYLCYGGSGADKNAYHIVKCHSASGLFS